MAEQLLHRGRVELIDALEILGMDAAGHEQAIDPEAVGAGQIRPHRIPDRQNAVERIAWPRRSAASAMARS